MDPPIHTEYFLSGGAMILILMVDGAKAVISFCILSAIHGYMVVPPDMTVLAYKSLRMSTSHFMMELYVVSWTPQDSIPKKDGWKRASGALRRFSNLFQQRVGPFAWWLLSIRLWHNDLQFRTSMDARKWRHSTKSGSSQRKFGVKSPKCH